MSMVDFVILLPVIFVVGIMIWIVTFAKDTIYPAIQNQLPTAEVNSTIASAGANWDSIWDSAFFFVSVGSGVAAVLLAFMIDTHPVFFFASILLIVIMMVIAPILSNTFRSLAMAEIFSGYADRFPMTTMLMANYPVYFLVFGFLIGIVMFAKIQGR